MRQETKERRNKFQEVGKLQPEYISISREAAGKPQNVGRSYQGGTSLAEAEQSRKRAPPTARQDTWGGGKDTAVGWVLPGEGGVEGGLVQQWKTKIMAFLLS